MKVPRWSASTSVVVFNQLLRSCFGAVLKGAVDRNVSVASKVKTSSIEFPAVVGEIAFHEKAGRSQVDSSLASLNKVLFSPPS